MTFPEFDELIYSEKAQFKRICRILLKQTFIVCEAKDEYAKMYYFVKRHREMFSDYFGYMGFDVLVNQDGRFIMLQTKDKDEVQINRHPIRKKYEIIVLCCLWTLYVDRIREGNLSSPILITVLDLRQCMEKYGVKEELEGKGILSNALDLFERYQLIAVNGELGSPECQIRLYSSLSFALSLEECKRLCSDIDERLRGNKSETDACEIAEEEDDET